MVSNAKKQRLNIEYEILYNKNFNPKNEIQVCYHNPVQDKFVDYDDYFQADPVDDYKKNELENRSDYSCHETRISVWDAEYNAYWLETKSPDFKIEKSIKLFQFDQKVGKWLNDYDKSKVGKLEITKVNALSVGDTKDKEIELEKDEGGTSHPPPKWGGNITDFTQDIENIPWDAKWTKSYPDDLVKLCSDVLNKYYIVAEAGIARADARYYHMNAVDALLGRKNVGVPRHGVSRPGPLEVIMAADFLDEFPKYKELIDDPIVVEARASVKAYADSLKGNQN